MSNIIPREHTLGIKNIPCPVHTRTLDMPSFIQIPSAIKRGRVNKHTERPAGRQSYFRIYNLVWMYVLRNCSKKLSRPGTKGHLEKHGWV